MTDEHDPVPPMLRGVWQRNLPILIERLNHLDHVAACCLAGTLTEDDYELARSNAHKLHGSLGTFGYPAGSDLAYAIETLLHAGRPVNGEQLHQLTNRLRILLQPSQEETLPTNPCRCHSPAT